MGVECLLLVMDAYSQQVLCKTFFGRIMENLKVIRVEVIAPEKPLLSKHPQK